jgi:hypothetical protein
MACNALTCISKSCGNNLGGLKEIYVVDQDAIDFNGTGVTVNITAHTVTNIVSSQPFLQLYVNPKTSSLTSEATIDLVNGSTFYSTTLNLVFAKREAAKSYALQVLGEGLRVLTFLVKDANNIWWMISDAQLSGGAEESGVAPADGAKYNVSFLADTPNRIYQVDSSIIEDLVTTCS